MSESVGREQEDRRVVRAWEIVCESVATGLLKRTNVTVIPTRSFCRFPPKRIRDKFRYKIENGSPPGQFCWARSASENSPASLVVGGIPVEVYQYGRVNPIPCRIEVAFRPGSRGHVSGTIPGKPSLRNHPSRPDDASERPHLVRDEGSGFPRPRGNPRKGVWPNPN